MGSEQVPVPHVATDISLLVVLEGLCEGWFSFISPMNTLTGVLSDLERHTWSANKDTPSFCGYKDTPETLKS